MKYLKNYSALSLMLVVFLPLFIGVWAITELTYGKNWQLLIDWLLINSICWSLASTAVLICIRVRQYVAILLIISVANIFLWTHSLAILETGSLLSIEHFVLLFSSIHDSVAVVMGSITISNLLFLMVQLLLIAAIYPLFRSFKTVNKALIALPPVLAIALLIVSNSALFNMQPALQSASNNEDQQFSGYLESMHAINIPKNSKHNVLIFIFESLSWRYSSFSQNYQSTEFLKSLADEGVVFKNAHAITPHSSKSIFSILCGSMPLLNQSILETASNLDVECLPHLYKKQGYKPIFIQSASGGFEARPRLVNTMGFEQFIAREDMNAKKLGYLASDDMKMVNVFKEHVKQSAQPFFATVFTSTAHHPYVLPDYTPPKLSSSDAFIRYQALQQRADNALRAMVDSLKQNGEYDNTLIIALGDHGEGFGQFGVKQHDMNYFDEGIHVPVVIKLPKELQTQQSIAKVEESLISLKDIAHYAVKSLHRSTDVLGILSDINLQNSDREIIYFNCWYQKNCFGWIKEELKTVLHLKKQMKDVFSENELGVPESVVNESISENDLLETEKMFTVYFNEDWQPKYEAFELVSRAGRWICNDARCKFKRH